MRACRWRLRATTGVVGCAASLALLAGASSALAAAPARQNPPYPHSNPLTRVFTPAFHLKGSTQPRYRPVTNPWLTLKNAPPTGFFAGSMIQMTDGSVLVHEDNTGTWERLRPDSHGSYVNGTWSAVATMPAGYQPEYYASQVLPNQNLIVVGGEYNGGNTEVWTNQGAIYNNATNTWTSITGPSSWSNVGDAQSVMLPNYSSTTKQYTGGTMMLAHPFGDSTDSSGTDDALLGFSGSTPTWTVIPGKGKLDRNDEEGWTLLSSGRVLTIDIEHNWNGTIGGSCSPCTSELFAPLGKTWIATGNVPVDLPSYQACSGCSFASEEMGPVIARPDNTAFAIGGNDATATYNASSGTWTAGPTLSGNQDSADGAASILPDGNVLFDASPGVFNTPTHFFVWNGSTLTQVADTANAPSDTTYTTRFMVLPTGQVMFDDGTGDVEIYNGDQTPNVNWRPSISSLSATTLTPGQTYTVSGTQLSGRSDGSAYGDDNQDATNYPLVRITNNATGVVTYAHTGTFSYAIGASAASSARFFVPAGTPAGASTLVVVANGIASAPQAVTVS